MAVFTHVPRKDLEILLTSYDIGELQSYEGIEEGVENTNYKVVTTKGSYILTLFETRIRAVSLPYCFHYMEHLHKGGISCPYVIKDTQGYETRMMCSRPASFLNFLEGRPIEGEKITPDHCYQIGEYLAKMHKGARDFEAFRANPMGIDEWDKLYCRTQSRANEVEEGLADLIIDNLMDIKEIKDTHLMALPQGSIHGDLFPDNVFFQDDKVSAVIDFYFSCNDYFVYDAAITFNAWCGKADFSVDDEKAKAFFKGYNSIRTLKPLEVKYFALVRRAAALRILLTRLYDWLYPPDEGDVLLTPKNPDEYIIKLKWDDAHITSLLK